MRLMCWILVTSLFVFSADLRACGPDRRPIEEIIEDRVQLASAIFVASLIDTKQERISSPNEPFVIRERARFKILQVIKGVNQTGILEFMTRIDEGGLAHCVNGAISAINVPEWRDIPFDETTFPSTWIIYQNARYPNELRWPSEPVAEDRLSEKVKFIRQFIVLK